MQSILDIRHDSVFINIECKSLKIIGWTCVMLRENVLYIDHIGFVSVSLYLGLLEHGDPMSSVSDFHILGIK